MSSLLKILASEYKVDINQKYTIPKIYHGGKSYDLSKRWYVYYSYYHPDKMKMVRQSPVYYNINKRCKTKVERFKEFKVLRQTLEDLLAKGYSPYLDKDSIDGYTANASLDLALSIKKLTVSERTYKGYKNRIEHFKRYLNSKQLLDDDIKKVKKSTVKDFLDEVLKASSPRNRNNTKRVLSSIFTELEDREVIPYNFIKPIKTLKSIPKKNKAFSPDEVVMIFDYLKKEDIWLYYFCCHVYYALFRPIEITRIKIGHINLESRMIESNTKTGFFHKQIPNYLYDNFYSKLKEYDKDMFLFTKFSEPSFWGSNDSQRRDFYTKNFKRKVIDYFNFGSEYSLYSFRHSAIGKLFIEKIKELKGQPNYKEKALEFVRSITLHKDNKTVEIYLREIGYYRVEDWSGYL